MGWWRGSIRHVVRRVLVLGLVFLWRFPRSNFFIFCDFEFDKFIRKSAPNKGFFAIIESCDCLPARNELFYLCLHSISIAFY